MKEKQTTIRVDAWIAKELLSLKRGTDSVGTVITRLLVDKSNLYNDQEKIVADDRNYVITNNGIARVGDTVVAIHGTTGKYTIDSIVNIDGSNAMTLVPKDKFTNKLIHSKSIYHDYAIFNRMERNNER